MHFTAFHPEWKMRDVPRTPAATLRRARRIALDAGVHHAYTGNVHDSKGGSSRCHHCQQLLIERDWYQIGQYNLTDDGRCSRCNTPMAGVIDGPVGTWGPRRLPVRLSA